MSCKAFAMDNWTYIPFRAFLPATGLFGALTAIFWKTGVFCGLEQAWFAELYYNYSAITLLYYTNLLNCIKNKVNNEKCKVKR